MYGAYHKSVLVIVIFKTTIKLIFVGIEFIQAFTQDVRMYI